jgi:hypothetical protein
MTQEELQELLARWRSDPIAFITEALVDPETGEPFVLYPAQERFFREALTPSADGRLPYVRASLRCSQEERQDRRRCNLYDLHHRGPGRAVR